MLELRTTSVELDLALETLRASLCIAYGYSSQVVEVSYKKHRAGVNISLGRAGYRLNRADRY